MVPTFETFSAAYEGSIRTLMRDGERVSGTEDPDSIGSDFGLMPRDTVELRPFGFTVRNPTACFVHSEARRPDLVYSVAQWLWLMRGSDNLTEISHYNPRGRLFSDDGRKLAGAFGARLRAHTVDQLAAAVERLKSAPQSRRAFVAVVDQRDITSGSRDFPCAIGMQFFVRSGTLEAITLMRSQSAVAVLPYDCALFMLTHAWVAARVGLPVGTHTWLANSFHVYVDELDLAEKVAAGPTQPVECPPLPSGLAALDALQEFERHVRQAARVGDRRMLERGLTSLLPKQTTFHDMGLILGLHASEALQASDITSELMGRLPSSWAELVRLRRGASDLEGSVESQ